MFINALTIFFKESYSCVFCKGNSQQNGEIVAKILVFRDTSFHYTFAVTGNFHMIKL